MLKLVVSVMFGNSCLCTQLAILRWANARIVLKIDQSWLLQLLISLCVIFRIEALYSCQTTIL